MSLQHPFNPLHSTPIITTNPPPPHPPTPHSTWKLGGRPQLNKGNCGMDCRNERKVEVESKENVRGVARYNLIEICPSAPWNVPPTNPPTHNPTHNNSPHNSTHNSTHNFPNNYPHNSAHNSEAKIVAKIWLKIVVQTLIYMLVRGHNREEWLRRSCHKSSYIITHTICCENCARVVG